MLAVVALLCAGGYALWQSGIEERRIPFAIASRGGSFANTEYFGAVVGRGRRVDIVVDSHRVSVFRPAVWNDLILRAELYKRADRIVVDSTNGIRLSTDSTLGSGWVDFGALPTFRLKLPRGADPANYGLAIQVSTESRLSSIGEPGERSYWYAYFDTLTVKNALSPNP